MRPGERVASLQVRARIAGPALVNDLSRRNAIRALLQGAAALAATPLLARAAAAESCADPASESLRASMNYAAVSADPAKTCNGCAFYASDDSLQSCGHCTIMSGHVDEGAVCDSWAARGG